MTNPLSLTDRTPRFALPLLHPAQAQKEFFVNQSHCIVDLLLHPVIQGELSTPPAAPLDGQAWIVGTNANGAWTGQDSKIAGWQAGTWVFVAPKDGMHVFDSSAGQLLVHLGIWHRPTPPDPVSGGAVQDTELRLAFTNLIKTLRDAGIFSAS